MAVAYLMEFPGGTLEVYDKIIRRTNPDGKPAPGGIFHVVGPVEGGLRIVDVWESEAAHDTFVQERLVPLMQELKVQPPTVSMWPVHNMLIKK